MEDVLQKVGTKGVHLIPATINLAGAEVELVSIISRETRLEDALAPIKDR